VPRRAVAGFGAGSVATLLRTAVMRSRISESMQDR
jgi:hypothetical protein